MKLQTDLIRGLEGPLYQSPPAKTDLKGTSQPHDDALVMTCHVGGFLVKRIMVNQGNKVEIMYLDL